MNVEPGMAVSVLCADGQWRDAVTTSGREPTHRDGRKVHDFPVVWVRLADRYDDDYDRDVPWPAYAVRTSNDGELAMASKDSTRTDGNPTKPRRTDLDQPDPGGSRDSATDR